MPLPSTSQKPAANLNCLQCQQHKRKCDKRRPCQMCIRRGFECTAVTRPRLPRGRHGNKSGQRSESELSRRDIGYFPRDHPGTVVSNSKVYNPEIESASRVYAPPCHEVLGICDLLVDSVTENTDDVEKSEMPPNSADFFFMASSPHNDIGLSQRGAVVTLPSKAATYALLDIYVHRIDPLLKVCHVPTLRSLLLRNAETSPAEAALKSAVYWAALCILTPQECFEILAESKDHLLKVFRASTEALLARAQLNTAKSLVALQAFIIYLIGLRTTQGWRAVWALIPVAIRIGQMHGLNRPVEGSSQFHTEIRCRLWSSIAVLELQAGLDGGMFSTCSIGTFLCRLPLHLDDSDISPTQRGHAVAKVCFCDMTFASMSYLVLSCMHKLIHVPRDVYGQPVLTQRWSDRHALVDECERRLRREYLDLCQGIDDFQKFTETVGEDMLLSLRLLAQRPISRLLFSSLPHDESNVLDLAITVIERRHQKFNTTTFEPWRWFAWTKWHALAILIVELGKDVAENQRDKAWRCAEAAYMDYMKSAPDGPIRTAMERLMIKARRCRVPSTEPFSVTSYAQSHEGNNPERTIHSSELSPYFATDANHSLNCEIQNSPSWVDWNAFMVDIEALNQLTTLDEMT